MKKFTLIIAIIFVGSIHSHAQKRWNRIADFGGGDRITAVAFSIGDKGYMGTGIGSPSSGNDFWEYDPSTDTWTQKANFGGIPRYDATGFSIGDKGYLGTGSTNGTDYLKDFWEYDPAT